jgi:SAM-dependent methyltransferase
MTPVTREDVVSAYRIFLHRDPESEEAVRRHMEAPSVEALQRAFLESAEFRGKYAVPAQALPLDLPANPVEVAVSPATLEALLAHVRRTWERLGAERPHHSVLTVPRFLPDALEANEPEFWASGEREAAVLERILARHGVARLERLALTELGCGVGRLTGPLARRFASVAAYDISAPHLEIARTRARNATFHQLRDLPIRFEPADVFYSWIVLQHNPPPVMALLVRNALECLRPGGLAVFQIPTYEIGYAFSAQAYLRRVSEAGAQAAANIEMHCLPQAEIFKLAAEAGCRVLEVREENSTGRRGSDVSNAFVIAR